MKLNLILVAAGMFAITAHAQSLDEISAVSNDAFSHLIDRFYTDAVDANGVHYGKSTKAGEKWCATHGGDRAQAALVVEMRNHPAPDKVDSSDLSDLSDTELEENAQTEAQAYFASHSGLTKDDNTYEIGMAHALHHHLLGDQATTYRIAFYDVLDALIADKE